MPPRTRSAKATASSAPAPAPPAPAKAPAKKRGKAAAAKTSSDPDPVPTNATGSGDDEEEEKPKKKTTSGRKRAKDDEDDEEEVVKPSKKKAKLDDDQDDADAKDTKDANDDNDDKEEESKKMTKVLMRGKAPVDPESSYVNTRLVYSDAEDVYDAMLNQSSIQRNNNKFYVIQLLHPIGNANSVYLFTRWGRVGERGQQATKGPWGPAGAIAQFKKQFKAKTATDWDDRRSMTGAQNMKYMWVERDYEPEKEVQQQSGSDEPIPDSTLKPEVQAFCNMIFSTKLLNAALTEMNYDLNKLPLGRLSKNTILQGFSALKKLADVLDDNTLSAISKSSHCSRLTDAYYSVIPHDFGRNRPRIINSKEILKSELELVDALGNMKIAQNVISDQTPGDADGKPINPLDAHFANLNLKFMDPITPSSSEYEQLQEYIISTHGKTHTSIRNPSIQHAFRVERYGEGEAWSNGGYDKLEDGERLLLWHGSRSTNFGGILSQGLRIAPPEAPVTGYMFGKGVYFADAMSKSANYCHSYASDGVGVMLLCEVASKPFFEQTHANYYADNDCKKAAALATKGLGRTQPKEWMDAGEALGHEELKGCLMPKGGLANITDSGLYLQYNEYIVYSASQIRLRYLLMVDMA